MTMLTASTLRSPCELLRKINDLVQGDTEKEKIIRRLCAEAEHSTKRLAQELNKYKKEAWKGWWAENKEFEKDIDRRLKPNYKQEGSGKQWQKH